MRLINTDTLELEWFMGQESAPEYAILSHTWLDGEVSFQDYSEPDRGRGKPGFLKLSLTCSEAKRAGIKYAWVDTCCIDKTSSAELTEAINSMFQWYAGSKVCYVYLPDLDAEAPIESMSDCRWFTRGWTLQELIAPREVQFYDSSWTLRGTKASLSKELSVATGISKAVLRNGSVGTLSAIPVAQRMAWAARRVTTRPEDMAYCLLGIFDVNMPMLYGEGEKAFIRLQEEIIKETNDLTLFAWEAKQPTGGNNPPQKHRGILAKSPSEFINASTIVPMDDSKFGNEFTMTNKGVRLNIGLVISGSGWIMPLNCRRINTNTRTKELLGISLKKYGARVYARVEPESLAVVPTGAPQTPAIAFISKRMSPEQSAGLDSNHRHAIVLDPSFNDLWKPTMLEPTDFFDKKNQMFLTSGMSSFFGFAFVAPKDTASQDMRSNYFLVGFGIRNSVPWATLCTPMTNSAAFGALRDLGALEQIMIQLTSRDVTLSDKHGKPRLVVSVVFHRGVLEGEPIHRLEVSTRSIDAPTGLPRRERRLSLS